MLTSNEFTIFVDFILHFFLLKGMLNYVLTVEQTSQPVGNTHLIIPPYYVAICYLYMSNMYAHIHLILICFFQHSFWNHTMQTNWFKVGIATSLKSSSNTQPLYPSLSFWSLQVILFITLRICNRCLTPRFLDISFAAINSSLEMSHSSSSSFAFMLRDVTLPRFCVTHQTSLLSSMWYLLSARNWQEPLLVC